MYPYVYIFGYPVASYWLMGVLGILVAGVYVYFTNRGGKVGHVPKDDLLHIACLGILGVLAGAKILAVITVLPDIFANWSFLMANPQLMLMMLGSGFVFYGGAIGGALTVYIYCRIYKVSFKAVAGLVAPAIPLFHTFGRIGCFLGGCCWGIEVPWGVVFPENSLGAPAGVPILPVQLIEAGYNFIIFIALAILSRKLVHKWMALPVYILCYGVLRFTLEFFRGDAIRGVFILSTSQWISLAGIIAVVVLYFVRWRHLPPEADTEETAPTNTEHSEHVNPA